MPAPKKPKLRSPEVDICRRVRTVREGRGMSQQAFADKLQIKRERLASYEGMRVALPYDIGVLIGFEFDISLRWLATGLGKMEGNESFVKVETTLAPPKGMLFGRAYDQFLKKEIETFGTVSGLKESIAEFAPGKANELLRSLTEHWLAIVPESQHGDFVRALWRFAEEYRKNRLRVWRSLQYLGMRDEDWGGRGTGIADRKRKTK